MLGWTDLKLWIAVCWKVSWNDEPLPLSVPDRPEPLLLELPEPEPDDDEQAATNKAVVARGTPAGVNRWMRRRCMSDIPPFLDCAQHQTPRRLPTMQPVLPQI